MTPEETGTRKESAMPADTEDTRAINSHTPSESEHAVVAPHSGEGAQELSLPTHHVDPQGAPAVTPAFRSILFPMPELGCNLDGVEAPAIFADLNLDQVVERVTADRDEYNLKPYFYNPLRSVEAVNYRYDILRDLETPALLACVRSFGEEMRYMRALRAQEEKLYYKRQKQSCFLDAGDVYCGAVKTLCHALMQIELSSVGFRGLRGYLANYSESEDFNRLVGDTRRLKSDLNGITYSLHISGRRITASEYRSEPDYGADVLRTFAKFNQGTSKDFRFELRDRPDMDHIEAAILDMVARLYPETFSALEEYCDHHKGYLDCVISTFDREVQFYLAWIEYIEQFKQVGLAFCYPLLSDQSKEVRGRAAFDLALASKLVPQRVRVVTNDFFLRDSERIFVVSGPNQGGKTTFARTFGQLHYLASIGCPVPSSEARLFLFDRLFTHFEKEEDILNKTGKLEDELIRIHQILEYATPNSILIMNESFLSTTLNDALFLSEAIMQKIIQLDMLCVSVTFLDEMASMSNTTVSMVSTVDSKNQALRTFKVVRRPADGLAYAAAIAETYRLTYGSVKERVLSNVKRGMSQ